MLHLTWPYPTLCMYPPPQVLACAPSICPLPYTVYVSPRPPRYSPVLRLSVPYPTLCMYPPPPPPQVLACAPSNVALPYTVYVSPAPGTRLCSVYLSLTLHCVCIPPPQVLACAPSNVALPYTVYVSPHPRYSPVLRLTWPDPTLCMYPPAPGTRLHSV